VATIIKKYDSNFNEAKSLRSHSIAKFIDKYGKAFRDDYVNFGLNLEQKNYSGYEIINKTMALLKTMHQQNKNLYLLTSNSAENVKPSPSPFKLIYTEDNNRNQYLMIGDSISDRGFAENIGIDYLDVADF